MADETPAPEQASQAGSETKAPEQKQVVLTAEEHQALLKKVEEGETRYKALQRDLNRARQGGQRLEGLQAELQALRKQNETILAVLGSAELVPEEMKTRIAQAGQQLQTQQAISQAREYYGGMIVDVLDEAGMDREAFETDDRLKAARDAWYANNYAEALRLTQKLAVAAVRVDPKAVETQVKAEVEKRVQEELKKSGVRKTDTGEGTAPAKGTVTLDQFVKMSPEERLVNLDKVKAWIASQQP